MFQKSLYYLSAFLFVSTSGMASSNNREALRDPDSVEVYNFPNSLLIGQHELPEKPQKPKSRLEEMKDRIKKNKEKRRETEELLKNSRVSIDDFSKQLKKLKNIAPLDDDESSDSSEYDYVDNGRGGIAKLRKPNPNEDLMFFDGYSIDIDRQALPKRPQKPKSNREEVKGKILRKVEEGQYLSSEDLEFVNSNRDMLGDLNSVSKEYDYVDDGMDGIAKLRKKSSKDFFSVPGYDDYTPPSPEAAFFDEAFDALGERNPAQSLLPMIRDIRAYMESHEQYDDYLKYIKLKGLISKNEKKNPSEDLSDTKKGLQQYKEDRPGVQNLLALGELLGEIKKFQGLEVSPIDFKRRLREIEMELKNIQ